METDLHKNPKISIIIPVYNAEKYLLNCIDSILNQKYTDYELILVNDGSTDSSLQICEEYSNTHHNIHVINQINGGVHSARNAGMNIANGEFITFMDADDWAEANWLHSYMDILTKKNESFDLLVQGLIIDYGSHQKKVTVPEAQFLKDKVIDGFTFLENQHISGFVHNKMYKTSIIKKNKLIFQFTFKEDLLFNIIYCSHIRSMYIIDTANYHYMQNQSNSLIKKRYPPSYMLTLIQALKEAGLTLSDNFQSTNYNIYTWERYFSDYTIILANLYKDSNSYSRKGRIEIIKKYQNERKNKSSIKPHFQEKSKKIFEKVSMLPPFWADFIFSFIFKVINSLK